MLGTETVFWEARPENVKGQITRLMIIVVYFL